MLNFASLIQQQGKFEGHKKLPQGLRPRTLCEAHDFKAQAKAVYHMASVRHRFLKQWSSTHSCVQISETSATARAQEKIVKESKGPISAFLPFESFNTTKLSTPEEQCRNTVRGEFDWVDVGPSRRLVARERPANPPCKQTQSKSASSTTCCSADTPQPSLAL